MKSFLMALVVACSFLYANKSYSWDGFDAATSDLVEVYPDKIPNIGDKVEVRDHDTDTSMDCLVETVIRNRRTIELMVRNPDGDHRILVMENR